MTALKRANMPFVLHYARHVCLPFTLQNNNENSEKQWFSNQVAARGTEVSFVALKSIHFQRFIAVILHPKGKAMDGASISFREELRLDAPQRTGFPEQLPFGMGTASYEG